jgi:hypothetical protein
MSKIVPSDMVVLLREKIEFKTIINTYGIGLEETLNKLIPIMVRQAHHERNQPITELGEGLFQKFL